MQFDILEIQIHAFLSSAVDGGLHASAASLREKRPRYPLHEVHEPQSLSVGSGTLLSRSPSQ